MKSVPATWLSRWCVRVSRPNSAFRWKTPTSASLRNRIRIAIWRSDRRYSVNNKPLKVHRQCLRLPPNPRRKASAIYYSSARSQLCHWPGAMPPRRTWTTQDAMRNYDINDPQTSALTPQELQRCFPPSISRRVRRGHQGAGRRHARTIPIARVEQADCTIRSEHGRCRAQVRQFSAVPLGQPVDQRAPGR